MSSENNYYNFENDFDKLSKKYNKNKLNISFNRVAFIFFIFVLILIIFSLKAFYLTGKKLPKKADIVIHFHSNLVIFDNLFQAIKIIIIEEKIIRREPN